MTRQSDIRWSVLWSSLVALLIFSLCCAAYASPRRIEVTIRLSDETAALLRQLCESRHEPVRSEARRMVGE